MKRLDLFLRAGGAIDPYTWSLLDDEQRQQCADVGDDLRAELAAKIAASIIESFGIDPDEMAQQMADLMAREAVTP